MVVLKEFQIDKTSNKTDTEQIVQYLSNLREEIGYYLNNLSDSNVFPELQDNITQTVIEATSTEKGLVSDDDEQISQILANEAGIQLQVKKKADTDKLISLINLSSEGIVIQANKLNLNGLVTITALGQSGATTINADNIKTGKIKALTLEGCVVSADTGLAVTNNDVVINAHGLFVKNTQSSFDSWNDEHGSETYFQKSNGEYSPFSGVVSAGQAYSSDARIKENINYDMDEYGDLLDELKPCTFNYIDGVGINPNKTHIGVIAQDVLAIEGTEDLAIVNTDNPDRYTVDKTELIGLLISEVQKLKKEVKELKEGK